MDALHNIVHKSCVPAREEMKERFQQSSELRPAKQQKSKTG